MISRLKSWRGLGPGIALSVAVACISFVLGPFVARIYPLPSMIIALLIGIALSSAAERLLFHCGIEFCVKNLLRWSIALLGLRISLGEILALGLSTAALVIFAMLATMLAGFVLARLFSQSACYGALAGAGTAVCGASATLAASTVLPNYSGKHVDIVFVVIAVNALSTIAMVVYPALCAVLGLDDQATGILLGGTIHDVAQVVGAAYSVSEPAGNTATIVKLFRVFLLLPVVLGLGLYFSRDAAAAKVPMPIFALVFLALCIVNSIVPSIDAIEPAYKSIKLVLVEISNWGLLIAIAALGLSTSLTAIGAVGWQRVAIVTGTTIIILVVVTSGLLYLVDIKHFM